MNATANDSSPGDGESAPRIPDFDLVRPIGQGGFGQVWLAVNQTTDHLRAVKLISLHRSGTAARDPAGREITSLARLEANVLRQHPNLLTIHHVGKTAEHLFYVMDLADDVSGCPASRAASYRPASLRTRLEDGPLTAKECQSCTRQLLAGLVSLHQAGMIHRDVKPANCLFVAGELKLADFGLLTEVNQQLSQVGTEKYMPPDGRMDTRADVYAAGLVIYEMLTGLAAQDFPRLGERAKEIVRNRNLATLLRLSLRACQPEPQRRYADAREMLSDLEESESPATARSSRVRRLLVAAVAVCALAAGLAAFWVGRTPRVHVNFITYPFEATIHVNGEMLRTVDDLPYRTPCTVEDLPAKVHHVVFKHEDRASARDAGDIDFSKVRQIVVNWDAEK